MADLLKTNYKDDILNLDANTQRKYQMTKNDDDTISLIDVTDYSQIGDTFASVDINNTNAAINQLGNDLTDIPFKYHVYVSTFVTGSTVDTNYEAGIPDYFKEHGIEAYMMIGMLVSNVAGTSPSLASFYNINYIGSLKTATGTYTITNGACLNKPARGIWVWWK